MGIFGIGGAMPLLPLGALAAWVPLAAHSQGGADGCAAADVNGDGERTVADLLQVLQVYGSSADGCAAPNQLMGDLNADCAVDVRDVLACLQYFGVADCDDDDSDCIERWVLPSWMNMAPCRAASSFHNCGHGGRVEPDWRDPEATCAFLDTVYSTGSHDHCLDQCADDIVVNGYEFFLACHGGVTVFGSAETDSDATVSQRAELRSLINGHCLGPVSGEGVRTCVSNSYVLDAVGVVPRHMFLPQTRPGCSATGVDPEPLGCEATQLAYSDGAYRVGYGATIGTPTLIAVMLQLANVQPGDRVLEIGTGSGYQTAVLVAMGLDVFTIEIVPELHQRATDWLTELGYMSTGRLHTRLGDGYLGWPDIAPFDAIIVNCAPNHVPIPLQRQLRVSARLVLPVGPTDGGEQSLHVVTRLGCLYPNSSHLSGCVWPGTGSNDWTDTYHFGVSMSPFQGDCHDQHCETVDTHHPICPAVRAAQYLGSEYHHAQTICSANPCEDTSCGAGHVPDPTCCLENSDGLPCQAVFRDPSGVRVACDGSVVPCEVDADCDSAFEGWCRATEHVAIEQYGVGYVRRQCVNYSGEGDECGGFHLPWLYHRCDVGLICVKEDGSDRDASGTCH